jgi:hypothetical protein
MPSDATLEKAAAQRNDYEVLRTAVGFGSTPRIGAANGNGADHHCPCKRRES